MEKKKIKAFILILTIAIFFVGLFFGDIYLKYNYFQKKFLINTLQSLDLENYNNLMIVAHPDDEMFWGSSELLNKNYLVVCVTCGNDKIRVKEFKSVMKETNDKFIMLGYPDKIMFKRSNWKYSYKYITRDLKMIEDFKDWNMIVTHNKKGEYGHQHHKMVSKIVKNTCNNDKMYVFGRYCSEANLRNGQCSFDYQLNEEALEKKETIINKYYNSQEKAAKRFEHMFSYETINKVTP